MAGIVPRLPDVHLTLRAIEWLTASSTMIGKAYRQPVARRACDTGATVGEGHDPVETCAEWSTGVADVRALWLTTIDPSLDYKVTSISPEQTKVMGTERYRWVRGPILTPTCMECRVRLDAAMERAISKTGAFRDVTKDGKVQWRYWDGVQLQRTADQWQVPHSDGPNIQSLATTGIALPRRK